MIPNVIFSENQDQIQRELERIECALRDPQTDERYCQLYAAQQALAWALDPSGFASPFATIQRGLVMPLNTQEARADCQVGYRHSQF
jgi:hypothetical protein